MNPLRFARVRAFSAFGFAALLSAADVARATPRDDFEAALARLCEAPGHEWTGEAFGGYRGVAEKNGFTVFTLTKPNKGDDRQVVVRSFKSVVLDSSGAWLTPAQRAERTASKGVGLSVKMRDATGQKGSGLHIAPFLFPVPARDLTAFLARAGELERNGNVITGKVETTTRNSAGESRAAFERWQIWLQDGAIAKYAISRSSPLSGPAETEPRWGSPRMIKITAIGPVKVDVPEAARIALDETSAVNERPATDAERTVLIEAIERLASASTYAWTRRSWDQFDAKGVITGAFQDGVTQLNLANPKSLYRRYIGRGNRLLFDIDGQWMTVGDAIEHLVLNRPPGMDQIILPKEVKPAGQLLREYIPLLQDLMVRSDGSFVGALAEPRNASPSAADPAEAGRNYPDGPEPGTANSSLILWMRDGFVVRTQLIHEVRQPDARSQLTGTSVTTEYSAIGAAQLSASAEALARLNSL